MRKRDSEGLKCPACGSARMYVKDTKSTAEHVRRRRKCEDCLRTMTTYEVIEQIGDPAGTKIGDMLQLRQNLMKLTPTVRMAVRQLVARLSGEAEPMRKVPDSIPTQDGVTADNPPEDIPT